MDVSVGLVTIEVKQQLVANDMLKLERCPHCSVHSPNLSRRHSINTKDYVDQNLRTWHYYICSTCGNCVMVVTMQHEWTELEYYPRNESVNDMLPDKVKAYLQQAIDSVFAPAGSVMLLASAVDAMLKDKGLVTGSLYARIGQSVTNGLLTSEMSTWAHQVRLDANDQRHADENSNMPTIDDAKRLIEFVKTLAEIIYVLPAKVTRGLASSS